MKKLLALTLLASYTVFATEYDVRTPAQLRINTGPLGPCMVNMNEPNIVTVAVVLEGRPLATAVLYDADGAKYRRSAEEGYSALVTGVAFAAGGRSPGDAEYGDFQWPLETHCEFSYTIDGETSQPVNVYVYKVDPRADFNMHPSWLVPRKCDNCFEIDGLPGNGLALLAKEIDETAGVEVTWRKHGVISY